MMKYSVSRFFSVLFFSILCVCSFLISLSLHEDHDYQTWKGEIWADRAGYYVYLPGALLHRFDVSSFPEKIDEKTGYGFILDQDKNRIRTKYTCGVAVMLIPFFIPTHFMAKLMNWEEAGGFGPVYHKMIGLAAILYLIFGLWLLKLFLAAYFRPLIQYLSIFFIYAGTNLLYYTVDDPLMSHVYSFFLFSLFLFSLQQFLSRRFSSAYFLLLSLSLSLSVLIRPTNILLMGLFFFWDVATLQEFGRRIRLFLKPKFLIPFLVILCITLLPQLLYWKYLSGTYFAYSYGDEGFRNWANPRFAEVWFSTLNGLFLYSPLYLVIVAGIVLMIIRRRSNGIMLLCLFLAVSYLCAAWQTWYFGCSFGQRSFVEYSAILIVPFGVILDEMVSSKRRWVMIVTSVFILFFTYYTIRMTFGYEKCFFGSTWDGGQFLRQLEKSGLYKGRNNYYPFRNDFENQALCYGDLLTTSVSRSGMYSVQLDSTHEFAAKHTTYVWDFHPAPPTRIKAGLSFYKTDPQSLGAMLVCAVDLNGQSLFWESSRIEDEIIPPETWGRTEKVFVLPSGLQGDAQISIYVWNPDRQCMYLDDFIVRFQ
ncbi:MAG: hypothetical protein ISS17_06065 [Bacteroidales bacterium]|nr:hypothetical protein [Bacteroidales bacterium]